MKTQWPSGLRSCCLWSVEIGRRGQIGVGDDTLRAHLPDSREWWDSYVEEEEYTPDAEGLASFITEHLSPLRYQQEKESWHHDAIVNQTIGEGLRHRYRLRPAMGVQSRC